MCIITEYADGKMTKFRWRYGAVDQDFRLQNVQRKAYYQMDLLDMLCFEIDPQKQYCTQGSEDLEHFSHKIYGYKNWRLRHFQKIVI